MKKQKSSKKIVHKTNAMRILDKFKLQYECISYSDISAVSGRSVADALLENPNQVFKTLVAQGDSKKYYVFMIPVTKYLNLKSAAKITGEKSIDLIPQRNLLPLTGYVHGGCSPIGMKKEFPTFIDSSVSNFKEIFFSGGKIGLQIKTTPDNLSEIIPLKLYELTD